MAASLLNFPTRCPMLIDFPCSPDRPKPTSTFHRVLSFQEHANKYLQTLQKGYTVYVEAGFELREPEKDADPATPQGQRQIFLRHGSSRVHNANQVFIFYIQRPLDSLASQLLLSQTSITKNRLDMSGI